jgi:hypothetical protein
MILCHGDYQKKEAEESLFDMLHDTEKRIRTKIQTYSQFWAAEEYVFISLVDYLYIYFFFKYRKFQHHLLQQEKSVFKRLLIPIPQLSHSHLACKIEGYVCGFAKPELLDEEGAELYIPSELASLVRKLCVKNQPPEEDSDKFKL